MRKKIRQDNLSYFLFYKRRKIKMRHFSVAVLTLDEEWHEPGKVGWWGISFATPEQEAEFENNYEKKFIKEAKPEWNLTIVDCHI